MNSFPKYKYPYEKCKKCNHRLKPKYLQSNCNVYYPISKNKQCCLQSMLKFYGVNQCINLKHTVFFYAKKINYIKVNLFGGTTGLFRFGSNE